MLIASLFKSAIDVFGSEEKANQWFNTSIEALGNKKPIDMLDSLDGIEQIFTILGRIEHGVFS